MAISWEPTLLQWWMKSRNSWESLLISTTPRHSRKSPWLSLFNLFNYHSKLSASVHCERRGAPITLHQNSKSVWSLTSTGEQQGAKLARLSSPSVPGGDILWRIKKTVISSGTKYQPIADGHFATCLETLWCQALHNFRYQQMEIWAKGKICIMWSSGDISKEHKRRKNKKQNK